MKGKTVRQSSTGFHLGNWHTCPSIFVALQIWPVESPVMSLDADDGFWLGMGLDDGLN